MPRTEEFITELRLVRDLKRKCGKADGMLKLMDLERNFARKILVNCQLFYEKRNELAWSEELRVHSRLVLLASLPVQSGP